MPAGSAIWKASPPKPRVRKELGCLSPTLTPYPQGFVSELKLGSQGRGKEAREYGEDLRPSSPQSFSAVRASPQGLAKAIGVLGLMRKTGQG